MIVLGEGIVESHKMVTVSTSIKKYLEDRMERVPVYISLGGYPFKNKIFARLNSSLGAVVVDTCCLGLPIEWRADVFTAIAVR